MGPKGSQIKPIAYQMMVVVRRGGTIILCEKMKELILEGHEQDGDLNSENIMSSTTHN
jgi:hypothetical protein